MNVCANCGHTKESHWDRYGCQVEGPDVWVEGTNCGGLVASGPCGCMDFQAEERSWPDQCLHRELAVTGIPGVFLCLEEACGEKVVIPELGETYRLSVASESLDAARASNANSEMLMEALKGHF